VLVHGDRAVALGLASSAVIVTALASGSLRKALGDIASFEV